MFTTVLPKEIDMNELVEYLMQLAKDVKYFSPKEAKASSILMQLIHKAQNGKDFTDQEIENVAAIKRMVNLERLDMFRPKDIDFDHWKR
jgi:tRNA C32,U32 (ribose-2'-O)-methylase TrmJ